MYRYWYVYADFDEKCSKEDDWDVDMSAYYDYGQSIAWLYSHAYYD